MLILSILAVDMLPEATLNVSIHIVREMTLILCIVAIDTQAKATLNISRHIVREMAPMFSVFAVNITASQLLTAVKLLPVRYATCLAY